MTDDIASVMQCQVNESSVSGQRFQRWITVRSAESSNFGVKALAEASGTPRYLNYVSFSPAPFFCTHYIGDAVSTVVSSSTTEIQGRGILKPVPIASPEHAWTVTPSTFSTWRTIAIPVHSQFPERLELADDEVVSQQSKPNSIRSFRFCTYAFRLWPGPRSDAYSARLNRQLPEKAMTVPGEASAVKVL